MCRHDCQREHCAEQAVPERCPRFDLGDWHVEYDDTLTPGRAGGGAACAAAGVGPESPTRLAPPPWER